MRISDWSSDVCSSDLWVTAANRISRSSPPSPMPNPVRRRGRWCDRYSAAPRRAPIWAKSRRSEEHTSELQSLMRLSYADFCLKIKNTHNPPPFINKQVVSHQLTHEHLIRHSFTLPIKD